LPLPIEDEVALIKSALLQLTGSLVATRASLRIVASQPNLLLSQDVRVELNKSFEEGTGHLDKAIQTIGTLVGVLND
jgi:hypothetical protein